MVETLHLWGEYAVLKQSQNLHYKVIIEINLRCAVHHAITYITYNKSYTEISVYHIRHDISFWAKFDNVIRAFSTFQLHHFHLLKTYNQMKWRDPHRSIGKVEIRALFGRVRAKCDFIVPNERCLSHLTWPTSGRFPDATNAPVAARRKREDPR